MTRDELRELYEYTDWANDRLVVMLYRAFGEETDLYAAADPRLRAIQETAVHIIGAQAIWRTRWQGSSPAAMLAPEEYPTPLAIRMAFGAERARFWGFFETLSSDEALTQALSYRDTRGNPFAMPLIQQALHVVTHGVYHRGQITGRLLDLGFEDILISTDLIAYYREKR